MYSWVSKKHFQKYLDEYSYRINRSIHKQTIFDNLINRMTDHINIDFDQIKLSA